MEFFLAPPLQQFYGACLQPESLFLVTELMAGTLLWCDACGNGVALKVLETVSALCLLNRGRDLQAKDRWKSPRQAEPCHLELNTT